MGSSPPTETTETDPRPAPPGHHDGARPLLGSLAIRRPTTAGTNLLLFPDPSPPFGEIEISSTLGAFGTSASASTSLDLVDARTLLTGAALSTDATFNAEPGGTKQLQISLTFSNPEPYTYDRYELVAGTGDGATGVATSALLAFASDEVAVISTASEGEITLHDNLYKQVELSAEGVCAVSGVSPPPVRATTPSYANLLPPAYDIDLGRALLRSLTRRRAGCSPSTSVRAGCAVKAVEVKVFYRASLTPSREADASHDVSAAPDGTWVANAGSNLGDVPMPPACAGSDVLPRAVPADGVGVAVHRGRRVRLRRSDRWLGGGAMGGGHDQRGDDFLLRREPLAGEHF